MTLTRALLTASLVVASGCQSEPTDFLQRTAEDCRSGDAGACELLTDLRPSAFSDAKPKPARGPATPVQRDVDAIMEGMRHAKSAPPASPQPDPLPSDAPQSSPASPSP